MDQEAEFDTPVLVVGAGPAGLTTSLLLARAGVRSLLIERRGGLSVLPRATGINVRTMEIFRAIGIADRIMAAAMDTHGLPLWVQLETLASPALASLTPQDTHGVLSSSIPTPVAHVQCAQDRLEPILYDELRRYGQVDIRFNTELTVLRQDANGVTVEVEDRLGQRRYAARATYVVGADGAHSQVRAATGITMRGEEHLGRELNILFEADLASLVQGHHASLYLVRNREMAGIFRPVDEARRWTLTTASFDDPTPDRCAQVIRAGAGDPTIEPRIILVQDWELAAAVAGRLSMGRVFLVGDAAHRMTPGGAFGMNTAVQDAHNLAWKLAARLSGWGAPALLDSYDAERRPVAEQNAALSWEIWKDLGKAGRTLGGVLGFSYLSQAMVSDGSEPQQVINSVSDFIPSARPGHRAPHYWLNLDGRRLSTLDLFDGCFVLLSPASNWCAAADEAASRRHIPVASHRIDDAAWERLYGVGDTGAVLVRPDGHVAWRDPGTTDASADVLEDVFSRVLGFYPPGADVTASRAGKSRESQSHH